MTFMRVLYSMIEEGKNYLNLKKPGLMARGGKVCIELNFTRGGDGKSRRAKMKSFWEFIEASEDLVPLQSAFRGEISESMTNCLNSEIACCDHPDDRSPSESVVEEDKSDVCTRADQLPERGIWHEEFQIFKKLGLDRVALAASDACGRCARDQRNNVEKEPVFADCVRESWEDLSTDMNEFRDRLKLQKPHCSYKEPGKFKHLVQS